jgi:stage V sporulation protein G
VYPSKNRKHQGGNKVNITDIRIRRIYQDARLRAVVSVTVDEDLAIHDIKVIEGPQRLFVAMPSRRDEGGIYRDIVHPITPKARKELEDAVLTSYRNYLHAQHEEISAVQPRRALGELAYH